MLVKRYTARWVVYCATSRISMKAMVMLATEQVNFRTVLGGVAVRHQLNLRVASSRPGLFFSKYVFFFSFPLFKARDSYCCGADLFANIAAH